MGAKVWGSGRGARSGGGRGDRGSVSREGNRQGNHKKKGSKNKARSSKHRVWLVGQRNGSLHNGSVNQQNGSVNQQNGSVNNGLLKKDDLERDAVARRSRVGSGASGRSWIGGSGERASGAEIPGCKERGEWAELCFMERSARHGLRVSKPHGDSAPYDVVVEWGGRFVRVQVKSTIYRRRGESYSLNVMGPGRRAYKEDSFDFAAVYLIPVDTWYIIPFGAMGEGLCSLHFKPGGMRQKYDRFREAWELLKGSA